jgi:hypothetical protein
MIMYWLLPVVCICGVDEQPMSKSDITIVVRIAFIQILFGKQNPMEIHEVLQVSRAYLCLRRLLRQHT